MKKKQRLTWLFAGIFAISMLIDVAASGLPRQYDGRTKDWAVQIKDQGSLGTCWAFASLTALETSLPAGTQQSFSVDHMSLWEAVRNGQRDGGDYVMSMAYLLSWEGPVLESQDPYGDRKRQKGLAPACHVQEIQILEDGDLQKVKEAVLQYGGVQSSLYLDLNGPEGESPYYQKAQAAYCYTGAKKPNHDIVIVGWDDHYPKENFKKVPAGDGAFLCMNSWGKEFGINGYFYVSYYDSCIGTCNIAYTDIDLAGRYDTIYQTDLCGWTGQVGYESDTAWFANIYTASHKETLEAVGFYATGPETEYQVYAVTGLADKNGLNQRKLVASGEFEQAGFYTVPLKKGLELEKDQDFAVIVKITSPGKVHPVAVECDMRDGKRNVELKDGKGYISYDGIRWSADKEQGCNVCLKAYTSNR